MTDEPKKKRAKPIQATSMALKECRARGWDADKVEQRIPRCFITRDLFNVIDIVALGEGTIIGIQVTSRSGGNHAARLAKALAEPRLRRWLEYGGRYAVWSYGLRGKAGKRKLFELREQWITLADLPTVELTTHVLPDGTLHTDFSPLQAGESAADDGAGENGHPTDHGVLDQGGL